MKPNVIKEKSFSFALRVVKCYKYLRTEQNEHILSKQFLRSGTAIGALVRESEHAESNSYQRQIDVGGSGRQERHTTLDVGRSRYIFSGAALALHKFGRVGAVGMLAEVIGSGERVFEIELAIDALRYLISREQPGARTIRAGCKASGEEQDQPIPVENLRPHNEEQDCASQGDHGRERCSVDQQMQSLAAPATPDQIVQCATLVSHLTIITDYYSYDAGNSVRQLFSDTGAITDTYDYDAFGNTVARTGSTVNEFLYRGEQFDSALGLYYLRARFYIPRTGRFLTADGYENPQSSPINRSTAGGRAWVLALLTYSNMQEAIRSTASIRPERIL